MAKLASKFKKSVKGQHLIMKVKGGGENGLSKKADYDRVYYYFKMQIMNHHNSEPFIVKGVGEIAKLNMDYLLQRAEQELQVYF